MHPTVFWLHSCATKQYNADLDDNKGVNEAKKNIPVNTTKKSKKKARVEQGKIDRERNEKAKAIAESDRFSALAKRIKHGWAMRKRLTRLAHKYIQHTDKVEARLARAAEKRRLKEAGIAARGTTKRRRVTHDDEETDSWVQCEACEKWRRLPKDMIEEEGVWTCSTSPDLLHASCDVAQEEY